MAQHSTRRRRRASERLALLITLMLTVAPLFGSAEAWPTGPNWWPTDGRWIESQVLVPAEDEAGLPLHLNFGAQAAIDGDTLVTSTQFTFQRDHYLTCGHHDGCDWVYVYNRGSDGQWRQSAKLLPSDAQPGDTFGFAVAVDETAGVIAVGNPGEHQRTDKIYIFERQQDGAWAQEASFHIEYADLPQSTASLFGLSVVVSGYTVVAADLLVGSYVYEKIDNEWLLTTVLEGGGGPHALAIAADTLVTRYGWRDPTDCVPTGAKRAEYRIHHRIDGEWTHVATLDPEPQYGNRTQTIGTRPALNEEGTVLAIGVAVDRRVFGIHTEHCLGVDAPEPLDDLWIHTEHGAAGAVGSAWIFELIDGQWTQTADIPNPMPSPGLVTGGSVFGAAIAVSGHTAIIGAYGDFYNGGERSGAVYVYTKVGQEWLLEAKLRPQGSAEFDWFAHAVDISGQTIIAGAHGSSEIGSLHVFEPLVDLDAPTFLGG